MSADKEIRLVDPSQNRVRATVIVRDLLKVGLKTGYDIVKAAPCTLGTFSAETAERAVVEAAFHNVVMETRDISNEPTPAPEDDDTVPMPTETYWALVSGWVGVTEKSVVQHWYSFKASPYSDAMGVAVSRWWGEEQVLTVVTDWTFQRLIRGEIAVRDGNRATQSVAEYINAKAAPSVDEYINARKPPLPPGKGVECVTVMVQDVAVYCYLHRGDAISASDKFTRDVGHNYNAVAGFNRDGKDLWLIQDSRSLQVFDAEGFLVHGLSKHLPY